MAEGQEAPGLMVIANPPYGKRLFTDVPTFYRMVGSVLKKQFQGAEAWIISSEEKVTVKDPRTGQKIEAEPFDYIGLKPSIKIDLNNGGIDCQLRKYELFSGKFDEFRAGGKALDKKSADEKEDSKFEHLHKKFGDKKPRRDGDKKPFDKERKFKKEEDRKPRRTSDSSTERSYKVNKDGSISAKSADDKEKKPFRKEGDKKPFAKGDRKPFNKDGKKPFKKEGDKKPFKKEAEGAEKPRAPRKRREYDPNRPMFSADFDMSKHVLDLSNDKK